MTYDEILQMDKTLSQNNAEKLLAELLLTSDWRCYSSILTPEMSRLMERFLQSHAKMPGFVTDEILATIPIEVFGWQNEAGIRTHGALFTNGAVVSIDDASGNQVKLLFVDHTTAEQWGYPQGYLLHGERADEEHTEPPVQT